MGGGSQRLTGARAHSQATKKKGGLGSSLLRKMNSGAGRGGGQIGQYAHLFTTDLGDGHNRNMQSVLDMDDLEEMMEMAELAGKSFAAERQNITVISTCAPLPMPAFGAPASAKAVEHGGCPLAAVGL